MAAAARGFWTVGLGTLAAAAFQVVLAMVSRQRDAEGFTGLLAGVGVALFLVLPVVVGVALLQRADEEALPASYRRGVLAGMVVFAAAPFVVMFVLLGIFTNGFRAF